MEVQQQRLLAAIEVLVLLVARIDGSHGERHGGRERFRTRIVDLDDACAVLAEDATGARSGDHLGEVEDGYTMEWRSVILWEWRRLVRPWLPRRRTRILRCAQDDIA